jgi:hypothetical protein
MAPRTPLEKIPVEFPDNWLIVGLFYPPMPAIGDLFDA